MQMLNIGCHLSTTAGYLSTVRVAQSLGANTFAFFTRNPRGSQARMEDPADSAAADIFSFIFPTFLSRYE
jgi:deoxyribonuclease-4